MARCKGQAQGHALGTPARVTSQEEVFPPHLHLLWREAQHKVCVRCCLDIFEPHKTPKAFLNLATLTRYAPPWERFPESGSPTSLTSCTSRGPHLMGSISCHLLNYSNKPIPSSTGTRRNLTPLLLYGRPPRAPGLQCSCVQPPRGPLPQAVSICR